MAQITLHRPDCSVWLQIEKQWENNGLTKCILFWGGLCGVGQLSPKLLTANTASPSPAGYHWTPATPTEFCRPLRLAEKVLVCKNCFSFSWEWVIWHALGCSSSYPFFSFFRTKKAKCCIVSWLCNNDSTSNNFMSSCSLRVEPELIKAARKVGKKLWV